MKQYSRNHFDSSKEFQSKRLNILTSEAVSVSALVTGFILQSQNNSKRSEKIIFLNNI